VLLFAVVTGIALFVISKFHCFEVIVCYRFVVVSTLRVFICCNRCGIALFVVISKFVRDVTGIALFVIISKFEVFVCHRFAVVSAFRAVVCCVRDLLFSPPLTCNCHVLLSSRG